MIILYFYYILLTTKQSDIPVCSDAWKRFNFTPCEYFTSYSTDTAFESFVRKITGCQVNLINVS